MDRRRFLSALALLLSGCMPKSPGLTVGSKNFTEQLVLGELLAQYLARFTSVPINRRFYLAGTYICHQALLAGRIDMYVEYTGTALLSFFGKQPEELPRDPQEAYARWERPQPQHPDYWAELPWS